jgi:CheY-like chemotaxis protein
MPARLLVAGLDARSLLLAAPILRRDGHALVQMPSARELVEDLVVSGADLVVLGTELPDMSLGDLLRQIRGSPATRKVSVLVLVPAGERPRVDEEAVGAGANAVLRRPVDEHRLETWITKLLSVPRRVEARIAVQGQVVGTPRRGRGGHFYGLTRNLSVNGMLLASPIRLAGFPDLDLELSLPQAAERLRLLGRVVREAPEVDWPYLGYGVEFLFVPPDTHEALVTVIARGRSLEADPRHGIHSTVRLDDWVYEILEPVRHMAGWEAEIRRGPRDLWRPGLAGPFFVVEGASRESVLRQARDFVQRQARGAS